MKNHDSLKLEGVIGENKITGSLIIEKITSKNSNALPNTAPLPKYFYLKFLMLFILLTIGYIVDSVVPLNFKFSLLLLIPIVYGIMFYNAVMISTAENLNYLKKLTDLMTLLSSLLAATLVLLKVFHLNGSLIDFLTELSKDKPVDVSEKISFYTKSLLLFIMLELFAAFATIKFLFAWKEFKDARKAVNKKI